MQEAHRAQGVRSQEEENGVDAHAILRIRDPRPKEREEEGIRKPRTLLT